MTLRVRLDASPFTGATQMHAVLISMGTAGDVYPFIGLGIQLRARGHVVTLAANEHYRHFAQHCEFHFVPLVSEEETRELFADADIWHPFKSALAGARWARDRIGKQYAIVKEAAAAQDSVLIAYPPVFAARICQETLQRPLVSVVPMPWMIPSTEAPPTLAGSLDYPNRLPRPLRSMYWRSLEGLTDWLIGRYVNRVRRSLDLKGIRRVARWAYSPQMTLAMFPAWYAAPQSDWPANTQVIGFSMYDGGLTAELSDDLQTFLHNGDRPVVFTFGTGNLHAQRLFQTALEICRAGQLRGILLSHHHPQLPATLPPGVIDCGFAPFHQLLPHCAAIVHHGGLGTTAQALAAGVPQLILPLAWDQQDNATRVRRLGVGDWCQPTTSLFRLANRLVAIMSPDGLQRCRDVATRVPATDANVRGAQLIEELVE